MLFKVTRTSNLQHLFHSELVLVYGSKHHQSIGKRDGKRFLDEGTYIFHFWMNKSNLNVIHTLLM